jgi:hypothetical protein
MVYYNHQLYLYDFTTVEGSSTEKLSAGSVYSYCWTEDEFEKALIQTLRASQLRYREGGEDCQVIAIWCLAPPLLFPYSLPSYCDIAQDQKYFASSIVKKLRLACLVFLKLYV